MWKLRVRKLNVGRLELVKKEEGNELVVWLAQEEVSELTFSIGGDYWQYSLGPTRMSETLL